MTPFTDTISSQNTITVTKQNEIECDESGASGPFCNETAPTEVHGCSNLLALKHSEQVLNDDEIVAVEASIAKVLSENIETGFLENEPLFRLAQYLSEILDPAQITVEIFLKRFIKATKASINL